MTDPNESKWLIWSMEHNAWGWGPEISYFRGGVKPLVRDE